MNEHPELAAGPRGVARRIVDAIVDASVARPFYVVLAALLVIVAARQYVAAGLELRSDFLELLPRDSPGFIAFEQQLRRVGGAASLIVVIESPERAANERALDEIARRTEDIAAQRNACVTATCTEGSSSDACVRACGPELVAYVESGTKDVRAFFERNKWLYASLDDLEDADRTLDRQIAIRSGLVDDLESNDDGTAVDTGANEKKRTLGMDAFEERWSAQVGKRDDFPTGYFASTDGTLIALRVVSSSSGTGDRRGDELLARMKQLVGSIDVQSYHPAMKIGFAGDIANAAAEKSSVISEAAWATGIAMLLIVLGVSLFFRSFSAMFVLILPAALGVTCAYAFATATFGYVNTSGAFLGAIILGNGINYPIVLLGRYNEFRARGIPRVLAKKAAVWNAFRAELVGASVAGIAYGSLVVTRFRGFSQFGMIGFVGMLLVWLSIIPLVPAVVTLIERAREHELGARLLRFRRDIVSRMRLTRLFPRLKSDGSRGATMSTIAEVTRRHPKVFIVLALAFTCIALAKVPRFVADPWEYNFARLGSRGSKRGGAGEWSIKAEKAFGGKMNVAGAMMIADRPEQVRAVKAQILANDAQDPKGKVIHEISTVDDVLPGTAAEQGAKLVVLERIRERLTPRVIHDAGGEDERQRLTALKPPDTLQVLGPSDLPAFLRRRFQEKNGTVGTVFYVRFKNELTFSDGHNLLRMAATTDNVRLSDGTVVRTASRATVFAEMLRSMERDGPLATLVSLAAVCVVVAFATAGVRGFVCVIASLLVGVAWMIGVAAWTDMKLNFLNFIALPITFGIGCEYPFNVFDRSRLLDGDVALALKRSGGAIALCSYTTVVGYGSLLAADNQALQSFGRLAVAGEITTLLVALFLLPSLLHAWRRRV